MWSSTPGLLKRPTAMATAPAETMIRCLSACVLALLSATAFAAEEVEQLDAEFLEYLAHLEGDEDDWTLVAQADEAQPEPRKDADGKQPAKPAVDER